MLAYFYAMLVSEQTYESWCPPLQKNASVSSWSKTVVYQHPKARENNQTTASDSVFNRRDLEENSRGRMTLQETFSQCVSKFKLIASI
jgi:hypothetical protein